MIEAQWILMLLIVSFFIGALVGPKIFKWIKHLPKSLLSPNYLIFVATLENKNGRSRVNRYKK